jgi:hypothetical protein
MKLPTIDVIGNWGHFFLTGGPLAIGALLLGLALLRTKKFPRTTALLLIVCAGLNLICQFLTFQTFLTFAAGVLLFLASATGILVFLALAWLGVSILFPEKVNFSLDLSFIKSARRAIRRVAS